MTELPEYKGFKISISSEGRFSAKTDEEGEDESAWSLRELKEKLDKISKKQIRMKVFIKNYRGIETGTLTSLKTDRHGYETRYRVRVSFDKGSWGEESSSSVYPVTEENTTLAREYINLNKQATDLIQMAEEVAKKMKPIDIQELLK